MVPFLYMMAHFSKEGQTSHDTMWLKYLDQFEIHIDFAFD